MKNKMINFLGLFCMCLLTITACSSNTQNENTGIGAVTGAVLGGLAGSAIGQGTGKAVAIGVGAVAGALFGGYIGHSMDSSDNQRCNDTLNNNSTNQPHHWKNRKTGTRYTMTPTSNIMSYNGNNNCRKYTTTAVTDGKSQTSNGIACKQADGSWKEVSA